MPETENSSPTLFEEQKSKFGVLKNKVLSRLRVFKGELRDRPLLELGAFNTLIATRGADLATIPAYYLLNSLSRDYLGTDSGLFSAEVIAASMLTLSATELLAIRRKNYCSNSVTNFLRLATGSTITGITIARASSLIGPLELGMIGYAYATEDWQTLTQFLAARVIVKTVHNSSLDLLISAGAIDPINRFFVSGKLKTGYYLQKLKSGLS